MSFTKEELRQHQTRDGEAWEREERSEHSQQFNDSRSLVQTNDRSGPSYMLYIDFIVYVPCKEGILAIPISQISKVRLRDIGYLARKGLSQSGKQDYPILMLCSLTSHHVEHQGQQQAR